MFQISGRRRVVRGIATCWLAARVVGAVVGIGCTARGQAKTPIGIPASTEAARELAVALFEERRWDEAERITREVTTRKDAEAQDFVNVARVVVGREMNSTRTGEPDLRAQAIAAEFCAEAIRRDAGNAAAQFVAGVAWWMLEPTQDAPHARPRFERAVELAPSDPFARYLLASVLESCEPPEPLIALQHYERVIACGQASAGAAYPAALYRAAILLKRNFGSDDRSNLWMRESGKIARTKSNNDFLDEIALGRLGHIPIPSRRPTMPNREGSPVPVAWNLGISLLDEAGELRAIDVGDVDGDRRTDVVGVGERGLWVARQVRAGEFESARVASGDFEHVLVADLDDRIEHPFERPFRARGSLLTYGRSGARLFFAQATGWFSDDSSSLPPLGAVTDVESLDFDHDGVLDLLFATTDGVRLLRNLGQETDYRGIIGPIRFDDATARADVAGIHADWIALEDFDGDGNVDLLVGGGSDPTLVLRGVRRGRFERIDSKSTGLSDFMPSKPLLADFDHDGIADILAEPAKGVLHLGRGDGTFASAVRCAPLPAGGRFSGMVDVDLDGQPDAVYATEERGLCFTSGVGREAPPVPIDVLRVEANGGKPSALAPILDDLNLDGAIDVVGIGVSGAWWFAGRRDVDRPRCQLLLRGRKDNRFALGAVVEVRCGATYERRFVTRPDQLFSFAPSSADFEVEPLIRIAWPDGVMQYPLQSITFSNVENLLPAPDVPDHPSLPVAPRSELRLLIEQNPPPLGGA